ncbi:hypothetical protein KY290_022993 [Solanum tuberosum]|uniref:Uncharacterized protein n=1 Tax=Solanum tuberosum TaxID=4113 RepID=A0ABQ7V613_SOLTU|nr:hypothetical protein KY284_021885 [Solanum tuberosum]KAH0684287.1 hypothetical protein KY289_022039 [Solanum tuberosum]KAH0694681.1 hypothetical protein KY285_021778 [Solanum tuberosum]KAH0759500.1 hypothetical protein KY290_022993 [Solanum tuberosum]
MAQLRLTVDMILDRKLWRMQIWVEAEGLSEPLRLTSEEGNLRLGIKWSFEARDHVQTYELYNNETFVKCFFVESGAVIGFRLNLWNFQFIDSLLEKRLEFLSIPTEILDIFLIEQGLLFCGNNNA